MPGRMTDARWMDLLMQVRRYSDLDHVREELMIATILTGGECQLLGQRARIRVEWPDGLPFGWTEEQVRQMGEEMKAAALASRSAPGKPCTAVAGGSERMRP